MRKSTTTAGNRSTAATVATARHPPIQRRRPATNRSRPVREVVRDGVTITNVNAAKEAGESRSEEPQDHAE